MKINGSRPRPRVAFIESLFVTEEERAKLEQIFQSIVFFENFHSLNENTSAKEIDLLIIDKDFSGFSPILNQTSCISFSSKISHMPGPDENVQLVLGRELKTEELIENEIILPYARIRERENWSSAKGLRPILIRNIELNLPPIFYGPTWAIVSSGAIISDRHSNIPFATVFLNKEKNYGIAWFPLPMEHIIDWIEAIVNEWSKDFPDKFPTIGNWSKRREWLLPEELKIQDKLRDLEDKRKEIIQKFADEITELNKQNQDITTENDNTFRKLLTAQGNELVDIVKRVFEKLDFKVENIDEQIEEGKPKKEDIRLTKENIENWEAIVEVRGYTKSSGKEDDIKRLDKFSKLFNKEKGKFPSKMIYVVNGPIEIQPSQRQRPFESNPDFLESFGDDDGLVISTVTLYRLLQHFDKLKISDISNSIIESTGEWKFILPDYSSIPFYFLQRKHFEKFL